MDTAAASSADVHVPIAARMKGTSIPNITAAANLLGTQGERRARGQVRG
jgi:hypothetical protein